MIGNVIGNYVVKAKVGEGGMGVVYLAEHPRLGRKVAIKLLHSQMSRNATIVSRFFVEAKAATEIGSDHIVHVLDFGELSDGTSYLILEWLDGRSLAQVLRDETKLSLVRAIHVARGVARALAAAHAIGIVHRDLKPDNVFLVRKEDDAEFAKVLDFGIAKLMPEGNEQLRIKTETGALIGTPAYMSPEQCRGADKVDQRTDIYALGVIFYEMVTGRLPFEAQALGELLIQHMTEIPPSLRSLDASIPEGIDHVIAKALAKNPDQRFQRIDGFVDALSEAWGASGPIRTGVMPAAAGVEEARSPQSTLTRTAAEMLSPETPRPRSPLAIAGVATALLAAGGFVAWRHHEAAPNTTITTTAAKTNAATANTGAATTIPAPTTPAMPTGAATPTTPSPPTGVAVVPAPPALQQVKLELQVAPANAQITLDGKPLANPFTGELPRDQAEHALEVHAAGFHAQTRKLTLDRDQSIEVRLARETHHASTETPHPPGPPPTVTATTPGTSPTPPTPPGKTIYKGTKGSLITEFPEK